MSILGNLLKELRGNKSLRKVAEETGLSHSYIADIEKGYRRDTKTPLNPSPDTLKRLSEAYNYPYKKLLEAAGYIEENEEESFEEFISDPDLYRWYKELPKSDEEDLRRLRRVWEAFKEEDKK